MRFLKAWTMFYVTSVAKNMIFPSRLFFAKPCLRVTRRLTRVFHLTHFRKPFFQNGHVVKRAQNGGAVRLKRRAALRFLSFSSFWNSQSNTLYMYRYIYIYTYIIYTYTIYNVLLWEIPKPQKKRKRRAARRLSRTAPPF